MSTLYDNKNVGVYNIIVNSLQRQNFLLTSSSDECRLPHSVDFNIYQYRINSLTLQVNYYNVDIRIALAHLDALNFGTSTEFSIKGHYTASQVAAKITTEMVNFYPNQDLQVPVCTYNTNTGKFEFSGGSSTHKYLLGFNGNKTNYYFGSNSKAFNEPLLPSSIKISDINSIGTFICEYPAHLSIIPPVIYVVSSSLGGASINYRKQVVASFAHKDIVDFNNFTKYITLENTVESFINVKATEVNELSFQLLIEDLDNPETLTPLELNNGDYILDIDFV